MTKFPPIIDYSLPPFIGGERLTIIFQLPIGYLNKSGDQIEYKLLNNANNQSAFNGQSTQVVNFEILKNNQGQITITAPAVLKPEDGIEKIYKLQLRFKGIDGVSEWSSVCYLKQIFAPDSIILLNAENDNTTLTSESPIFQGKYNKNEKSTEIESTYQFILTNVFTGEEKKSEILNHQNDIIDSYVFPELLSDFTEYDITYKITTKNGYEQSITKRFLTSFFIIEEDLSLSITATNDFENGSIILNITSQEEFTGNLMLRRTSSKSNYTIWEDVSYLSVLNEQANIVYIDYYVECGVSYKYGIQKINSNNYRSYLVKSNTIRADFEDIFLISDNTQIKIKYNPQISNLKRNLLETKQDTIGNQYPFILKNGYSNYFSFSLGGLISYYAENNDILARLTTPATNRNNYNQIISPIVSEHTLNLTRDNIFNERIYREKVENFLTNGQSKLFKSPTEGNMIVYLMQVSLTPKNELGRMLYQFTSTAYEIASDDSLTNLAKLNIYHIGEYLTADKMGTKQIPIYYDGPVNNKLDLYALLQASINVEYETCYREMQYINSIILYTYNNEQLTLNINNGNQVVITQNGYVLDNVLNITSLIVSNIGSAKTIHIEGTAIVAYRNKDSDNDSPSLDLTTYRPVNAIGQFSDTLFKIDDDGGLTSYNIDICKAVEQKYGGQSLTATIAKFYSISYLKIQSSGDPFQMLINKDELILVPNDQAVILKYPITSCIIQKDNIKATVDFIYNGYAYD